jgi:isoleucyl-tRNA synthetase
LKDLEEARKSGRVGNKSLESKVFLRASASEYELLGKYRAALPELFNVSGVILEQAESAGKTSGKSDVEASATTADGDKCDRCWRYTTDVSPYGAWPNVCARCQDALGEMGIAPPQPDGVPA